MQEFFLPGPKWTAIGLVATSQFASDIPLSTSEQKLISQNLRLHVFLKGANFRDLTPSPFWWACPPRSQHTQIHFTKPWSFITFIRAYVVHLWLQNILQTYLRRAIGLLDDISWSHLRGLQPWNSATARHRIYFVKWLTFLEFIYDDIIFALQFRLLIAFKSRARKRFTLQRDLSCEWKLDCQKGIVWNMGLLIEVMAQNYFLLMCPCYASVAIQVPDIVVISSTYNVVSRAGVTNISCSQNNPQ